MNGQCYHCHEPLPEPPLKAELQGESRDFCCQGCIAVAQLVADCGLDQYYRLRLEPAPRPGDAQNWHAYDRDSLVQRVSRRVDIDGLKVGDVKAGSFKDEGAGPERREILLHFEGVRCAACSWLLQQLASQTDGIDVLEVNPATARGRVVWDQSTLPLSQLLATIAAWGYHPTPEHGREVAAARTRESRQALTRLAVAGIGMMQVMMYAVGLYLGEYQGMDAGMRDGLRWFSLILSIPVLWYAGWPILRNAWQGLRARQAVMDQPVALALLLAWTMSVVNTLGPAFSSTRLGHVGDVYFEAVTMFVFFLTLARFVEMRSRHRSAATAERLAGVGLVLAKRLDDQDEVEEVSADELKLGDRVLLSAGDTVAADGVLTAGDITIDESLLTGESLPLQRQAGASLLAGSKVISGAAKLRIEASGAESSLGHLQQMLTQAEAQRPQWSATADRVAGYFIVAVLFLAALVGLYWYQVAPERAFAIVLSVLVITCPCALSLAAPAALAAATGQLARRGIFIGGAEALGRLARIQHLLLDKTGTLTYGRFQRHQTQCLGALSEARCLQLTRGLLQASRHPVAQAFHDVALQQNQSMANWQEHPGDGISANIDGHNYRLGRPSFAAADATWPEALGSESLLALADEQGPLALFHLSDQLRPGAQASMSELERLGLDLAVISGDRQSAVEQTAKQLGLGTFTGEMRPQDKMHYAQRLQDQQQAVAMVGDGVNDAPVLAAADVSIALAHGAAIPKTRADVVLTGNDLQQLSDLIKSARQTESVIRQNLIWALSYNLCAVPAAAMGLIVPWVAALGMSLSSLVVVLNAIRAGRAAKVTAANSAKLNLQTFNEETHP